MIADAIQLDPRTRYRDLIKERGLKQTWVAGKAECSDGHLSNVLACKDDLSNELRGRLNKALGVEY
jgi:plasmid maintenance system antidote protein VapI